MPEPTSTNAPADPSFADLRAMMKGEAPPVVEPKAEPVVETPPEPEPAAAVEPAEPKAVELEEEPLPEGVVKRIQKETAKQADIQARIDRAVSETKRLEAEAAKLTGKSGSEPATNTAPANAKPAKPVFGSVPGETWGQYQDKLTKYDADHETWMLAEADKKAEARYAQNQAQSSAKANWDKAVTKHGTDFPAQMETLRATAPEGLQLAISALDDWSGVAVHLAKDPAKLKELADTFAANQYKAIATLGRIEASLKAPATAAPAQPLPAPPATPGGKASVSAGQFNFQTATVAQIRAYTKKKAA